MPISVLVRVRSFIAPNFSKTLKQCTVQQYHSDLSDQSALEITLGSGLDTDLHYFSIFFTENNEND